MCPDISGSWEVEPKVQSLVEVVWRESSLMWNLLRAWRQDDSTEERGRQRCNVSGNLVSVWSHRELWCVNCISLFCLEAGGWCVLYTLPPPPSPFLSLSINHQGPQGLGEEGVKWLRSAKGSPFWGENRCEPLAINTCSIWSWVPQSGKGDLGGTLPTSTADAKG